jgi:hypothetical protein
MDACRHCGREQKRLRPRGLCWTCYYTPAVIALYPSKTRYGLWLTKFDALLPLEATEAEPGSEAKVRVMEERVRLGYSCFHPDDAGLRLAEEEAA